MIILRIFERIATPPQYSSFGVDGLVVNIDQEDSPAGLEDLAAVAKASLTCPVYNLDVVKAAARHLFPKGVCSTLVSCAAFQSSLSKAAVHTGPTRAPASSCSYTVCSILIHTAMQAVDIPVLARDWIIHPLQITAARDAGAAGSMGVICQVRYSVTHKTSCMVECCELLK